MSPESPASGVTAVVLNWRDPESTRRCVQSLLAEPAVSHVVVVDNETRHELRSLESTTTLLEQADNLGFSRGLNIGLRVALDAGADAVLVINNDALVAPGAVQLLADRLEDRSVGIIAPAIHNPDGSAQSSGGRFSALTASTSDLADGSLDYLTFAAVLIPRSTLETVGLLDEAFFMYWEDVDYGLRVNDAGLDLVIVPQAVVIHERSKSHGQAGAAIDRYSARGLVVLARKRRGLVLFLGMPLRIAARLAKRISAGDAASLRAIMRGCRDGRRVVITP